MDYALIWFCLIGLLWAGYLVLEGFDFGVGALLPVLGSGRDPVDTEKRRRVMLTTIGPHWDGNEVWLLTAGGATFAAFPEWYATMFSALYLPFLVLLVALIVRNMGFEYRRKRDDDTWRRRWDWAIIGGSVVAPLLVGVALTNVVRGLPIDQDMEYMGNLFTLLNPMSLLGGLVVLGLSLTHGSFFLALKTTGDIRDDARALGTTLGLGTAVLAVVLLLWLGAVRGSGWSWVTTAVAALSLLGAIPANVRGREGWAFAGHGGDHRERGRDVLPRALPGRHALDPARWPLAEHRERREQRADPEDHDRRGARLHPRRPALHGLDLLDVPQAPRHPAHPAGGVGDVTPFDPRLLRAAPPLAGRSPSWRSSASSRASRRSASPWRSPRSSSRSWRGRRCAARPRGSPACSCCAPPWPGCPSGSPPGSGWRSPRRCASGSSRTGSRHPRSGDPTPTGR